MLKKRLTTALLLSVACLSLLSFVSPLEAAARISKTSKRIMRAALAPELVVNDLSAVALSTSSIMWTWSTGTFTASSIDGYYLYSSSTSTKITLTPDTSSFLDTDLGSNIAYTRWLAAFDDTDIGSDSPHMVKYTYAKPPNRVDIYNVGSSSVAVKWYYSNATAYAVECSSGDSDNFLFLRSCFVPPQTFHLLSNTTYHFRLGAINGDDEQTPALYSSSSTVLTPPHDPVFWGVAVSSCAIEWQWSTGTYTGTGITGYKIYRSTTVAEGRMPELVDEPYLEHEILEPDTSSWLEIYTTTPTENTPHVRWLKAVGNIESLGKTPILRHTYAVAPATCAVFTSATVAPTASVGTSWINLNWTATTNTSAYVVEYTTGQNFNTHKTTGTYAGAPSIISPLVSNEKYIFRIGALNGDGIQTPANASNPNAYSANYRIMTAAEPPTNLRATPISYTAIFWQWSTGTYVHPENIAGYGIAEEKYYPEHQSYQLDIVDVVFGVSTNAYITEYLTTNSKITRFVGVIQETRNGTPEDDSDDYLSYGIALDSATGCTFATPPNDVLLSTVTSRSVNLYWKPPEVPPTLYRIERATATGENGPWRYVGTASTNCFSDSGLTHDTTYAYRIGAINQLGVLTQGMKLIYGPHARDYSFVASTQTFQKPPTMYATAISSTSIAWNWVNETSGVSSFDVMTATGGILVPGLASGTTFWIETDLPAANTGITRGVRSTKNYRICEPDLLTRYTMANDPYNLQFTSTTRHSLTMEWSGNGGSRYRIDRSMNGGAWTTLRDDASVYVSTSFADNNLRLATSFAYRVYGYNGDNVLTGATSVITGQTGSLPSGINLMLSTSTATQQQTAAVSGIGTVTVDIPAGTLNTDGYVLINTTPASQPLDLPQGLIATAGSKLTYDRILSPSIIELLYYDLNGNIIRNNFNNPVRVALSYPDANNDGFIDGMVPATRAESLHLNNLSTSEAAWKQVTGSTIDMVSHIVYANIPHFSAYSLIAAFPVQANLGSVFVYPNPYKPGSGGQFDRTVYGEGVVFENLTARSKVRIFNIAGELVADLTDSSGTGRCVWNARTTDGGTAASGVYIYLITNDDRSADKKTGMFSIIK